MENLVNFYRLDETIFPHIFKNLLGNLLSDIFTVIKAKIPK